MEQEPIDCDDCDVLVIGAGPAGTAAAITLARAGARVIVADKATFPRDKCCGDGLTTGALRRLETLGLDPSSPPSAMPSWTWVDHFYLSTPARKALRFPLPAGPSRYAAVVERRELDAALVAQAREVGAEVREGWRLTALTQKADTVTATFETADGGSRCVCAPHAVAADGVWSSARKLLPAAETHHRVPEPLRSAWRRNHNRADRTDPDRTDPDSDRTGSDGDDSAGRYLGEWHGYRQYAHGVHTEAARDLWIWFEKDLLPGYLWSFPLSHGRVNIGFGIERRDGRPTREMKPLWASLLQRPHVRAVLGDHVVLEGTPKAWPIPAAITSAPLTVGRVLFAGDAARAGDALTGEGIGQALQTGIAAADAVTGARDPDDAPQRYRDLVLRELSPDHTMASSLVRLMSRRLVAESALRTCAANDWTRRNFARWLFEDYPRGIALTPSRWRWGLMSGPGAYEKADSCD